MKYMIKLKNSEKITISKEDFDKLTEGLFIDTFKFTTRSGVCQMVIPLENILFWYAVDSSKFVNQDLKPKDNKKSDYSHEQDEPIYKEMISQA